MRAGIVYAENTPLSEATFGIRENDVYIRITVFDDKGRHAYTNAYLTAKFMK